MVVRKIGLLIASTGLVLSASACSGERAPASPSSRSAGPGRAASQPVHDAIDTTRSGASMIKTVFEAHSDNDGDAAITLEGPYNFARHEGNLRITVAAAGTTRTFSELLTADAVYFRGLDGREEAVWHKVDRRALTKSAQIYRTPANAPETLLDWLEAAGDVERQQTGSVNGVDTTRYGGLVPLAAFEKSSNLKADRQYRALVAQNGDDAQRIDAYIDGKSHLRRIYLGFTDLEVTIKSQTELTPLTHLGAVHAPSRTVDGLGEANPLPA